MKDLEQISAFLPEKVCEAAQEVAMCICEALELSSTQIHYAALSLEAKAGQSDTDPAFARVACAVAEKLRKEQE